MTTTNLKTIEALETFLEGSQDERQLWVGFSHSDEFYEGLLSGISPNTDNRPSNVCVDREKPTRT